MAEIKKCLWCGKEQGENILDWVSFNYVCPHTAVRYTDHYCSFQHFKEALSAKFGQKDKASKETHRGEDKKEIYIPGINIGFYYSSSADRSSNDRKVEVNREPGGNYILGVSRNGDRNSLYEIGLDADDLSILGYMLIDLAGIDKMIEKRQER